MRSCEFLKALRPGRTIMIRLGGVRFHTQNFVPIYHNNLDLLKTACYVWVLFEDQKNREKYEAQTQQRTADNLLCPVIRFRCAVKWVWRFVKNFDDEKSICSICFKGHRSKFITQEFVLSLLRKPCKDYGGQS